MVFDSALRELSGTCSLLIHILSLRPKDFELQLENVRIADRRCKMQIMSCILHKAYRFENPAIARKLSNESTNDSLFHYFIVHVPQHRAERVHTRSASKSTPSTFVIELLLHKRPQARRKSLKQSLIDFDIMISINREKRHNIDALQHHAENLYAIRRF